ncbi:MAG: DUF2029 domain-containing protein [Acidobacteria bacterium]|nr:DUF2029 domain-containing protein [Acidobacteriota bacterium]
MRENASEARKGSRIRVSKVLTAGFLLLALGFAVLLGGVAITASYDHVATRDFVEYWAAGKLLVQGKDPYASDAVWSLEYSAGSRFPVIPMNPPFFMWMVAPLGFLNFDTAARFWLLLQLASVGVSIWVIAKLHERRQAALAWVLGLSFSPILINILIGQIGVFLLLAVSLFLLLHKQHPLLAGIALLPCAAKPHLFLPFGIVILLWAIRSKAYAVLAGFFAALFLTSAAVWLVNHQVWSQWIAFVHLSKPAETPIWNLSRMFRLAVGPQKAWVQFLPVSAACIWGTVYFFKRRDRWIWLDHGLLLLLVSVLCAPYSWFTDEAVLLPCIIAGVGSAEKAGRTILPLAAMLAISSFELLKGKWIDTGALVWTAPAWLAFYLYATRKADADATKTEQLAE